MLVSGVCRAGCAMRRVSHSYCRAVSTATLLLQVRRLATEYRNISPANGGAGQPPAITHNDPVMPMDFNPHIEWYEFPKEIFDPKYPYTNAECIRMTDETWESTMDEMASRYGMRLNMTTKPAFWMGWTLMVFYAWFTLWGCYRAMGGEPGYAHFRQLVMSQPNVPTIEEDDIYLDQWMNPVDRPLSSKLNTFWNWRPPVKRDGAHTTWPIAMQYPDESEWRHMTSAS